MIIAQMNSVTGFRSPNPILDLEMPLPTKSSAWDRLNVGRTIFVLVSLIVSSVLILLIGSLLRENVPAAARLFGNFSRDLDAFSVRAGSLIPVYFYLIYILSAVVCVAIHEAGHVAAGHAVGFIFEKVQVGPFLISRSARGLKFNFQLKSRLTGLTVVHVRRTPKMRRKYLFYSFAGPLANFLTGLVICLILAVTASTETVFRVPLEFFAAYSLIVGAANLVPYLRRNGMFTDGGRLLGLLRSKSKTKRFLSLLSLTAQMDSGKRPKELPQTWIANACAISDRSSDALRSFLIAYLSASDREKSQEAARYLELCLQRIQLTSPEVKKMILMEAAVFHAWFRNDAPKAEVWVDRSKAGPALPPLNQIRLRICMNWVSNRFDEVAADFEKARVLIEHLPESAAKARLVGALTEWKEELDKRVAERESQALGQATLNT
jgi:Peptidase family M50